MLFHVTMGNSSQKTQKYASNFPCSVKFYWISLFCSKILSKMEDPILPIDIKNSLQNAENCDPKDPCDIGLFDSVLI